ncbi:hypothetical protein EN45_002590 [Penicillium chrysogenum]|uniref:Uncharacterized protein n=1 Tax=Penicillium chrysogenum TaxID=5076 RepID=A0A161ZDY8_PENCH|nr:hypothetical protein EN45_002590 [Penicillium chrysogenum]
MYGQLYTINEFARTAAALASGFAKLGEQLAERGEFHSPVPEDRVVGLGFAARPFTVALERLDLHFDRTELRRPD